MRNLCLPLLLVFLAFTASALADDWSKTYDLTGKPDLRLEAGDASIRIDSWDQNKIEARVTTHGWHLGTEVQVVERQQGNSVDIEVRQARRSHVSFGLEARKTEVTIRMPRDAKVNVRSQDGSISARAIAGELEFSSGDGRLELEDIDGNLRAHTSDGSVRVSGRFDVLDLNTSDGRVEVEARQGSQIRQSWEVRTSDGSVQLKVPADLAADIDMHTGDGHITTNVPIVVEGSFSHENLHGKMNGGGHRLSVYTGDGSITLDKF